MTDGRLTRDEFERVVTEALDSLPPRFARLVKNVAIAVEEEPNAEDLASVDPTDDEGDDSELLGIYRGVPLTDRMHDAPLLPDEIQSFAAPLIEQQNRGRKPSGRFARR